MIAENTRSNTDMKQKVVQLLKSNFSFIGLLLVLILFEILTEGKLLKSRNLMNIFNNFYMIGLGSIGVTFLMSLGELDLSVGAIVAISSTMAAFAAKVDVALILPVALLTGIIVGSFNGALVAKMKVESFIGTLAVSFIARGLTTWLLDGTLGIPLSQKAFDKPALKIIVFVVVAVVCFILFEFTAFGKRTRSIGSSMEAARQSGVKVDRIRFLTFVISGLLCGLVGYFTLIRTCTASTKTGNAFEFDVLLAVLFGGMPLSGGWAVRFRAAIIGSVAMAVMYNGMSLMGVNGLTQQMIQGIILIVIVVISFDRKSAVVIK